MAKESSVGWSRTDRAERTLDSHGGNVPAVRREEREGDGEDYRLTMWPWGNSEQGKCFRKFLGL